MLVTEVELLLNLKDSINQYLRNVKMLNLWSGPYYQYSSLTVSIFQDSIYQYLRTLCVNILRPYISIAQDPMYQYQ